MCRPGNASKVQVVYKTALTWTFHMCKASLSTRMKTQLGTSPVSPDYVYGLTMHTAFQKTRDILQLIKIHYGYLIPWLFLLNSFLQPGSQLQESCSVGLPCLFATRIILFSMTLREVMFTHTTFQIKSSPPAVKLLVFSTCHTLKNFYTEPNRFSGWGEWKHPQAKKAWIFTVLTQSSVDFCYKN